MHHYKILVTEIFIIRDSCKKDDVSDVRLQPGELAWQLKNNHWKMYLLLKMVIFQPVQKHLSTKYFVEPRTFDDDPMAAKIALKCIEERSFNTH